MIVRTLDAIAGTAHDVRGATWRSRRLLVAGDRMGFSLHDTVMDAGTSTTMEYKHHLEAVYCIDGRGSLEDLATGECHVVEPGVAYALDRHDRHVLHAETALRVVCVFNPPVIGPETHGPDGAYPVTEPGR